MSRLTSLAFFVIVITIILLTSSTLVVEASLVTCSYLVTDPVLEHKTFDSASEVNVMISSECQTVTIRNVTAPKITITFGAEPPIPIIEKLVIENVTCQGDRKCIDFNSPVYGVTDGIYISDVRLIGANNGCSALTVNCQRNVVFHRYMVSNVTTYSISKISLSLVNDTVQDPSHQKTSFISLVWLQGGGLENVGNFTLQHSSISVGIASSAHSVNVSALSMLPPNGNLNAADAAAIQNCSIFAVKNVHVQFTTNSSVSSSLRVTAVDVLAFNSSVKFARFSVSFLRVTVAAANNTPSSPPQVAGLVVAGMIITRPLFLPNGKLSFIDNKISVFAPNVTTALGSGGDLRTVRVVGAALDSIPAVSWPDSSRLVTRCDWTELNSNYVDITDLAIYDVSNELAASGTATAVGIYVFLLADAPFVESHAGFLAIESYINIKVSLNPPLNARHSFDIALVRLAGFECTNEDVVAPSDPTRNIGSRTCSMTFSEFSMNQVDVRVRARTARIFAVLLDGPAVLSGESAFGYSVDTDNLDIMNIWAPEVGSLQVIYAAFHSITSIPALDVSSSSTGFAKLDIQRVYIRLLEGLATNPKGTLFPPSSTRIFLSAFAVTGELSNAAQLSITSAYIEVSGTFEIYPECGLRLRVIFINTLSHVKSVHMDDLVILVEDLQASNGEFEAVLLRVLTLSMWPLAGGDFVLEQSELKLAGAVSGTASNFKTCEVTVMHVDVLSGGNESGQLSVRAAKIDNYLKFTIFVDASLRYPPTALTAVLFVSRRVDNLAASLNASQCQVTASHDDSFNNDIRASIIMFGSSSSSLDDDNRFVLSTASISMSATTLVVATSNVASSYPIKQGGVMNRISLIDSSAGLQMNSHSAVIKVTGNSLLHVVLDSCTLTDTRIAVILLDSSSFVTTSIAAGKQRPMVQFSSITLSELQTRFIVHPGTVEDDSSSSAEKKVSMSLVDIEAGNVTAANETVESGSIIMDETVTTVDYKGWTFLPASYFARDKVPVSLTASWIRIRGRGTVNIAEIGWPDSSSLAMLRVNIASVGKADVSFLCVDQGSNLTLRSALRILGGASGKLVHVQAGTRNDSSSLAAPFECRAAIVILQERAALYVLENTSNSEISKCTVIVNPSNSAAPASLLARLPNDGTIQTAVILAASSSRLHLARALSVSGCLLQTNVDYAELVSVAALHGGVFTSSSSDKDDVHQISNNQLQIRLASGVYELSATFLNDVRLRSLRSVLVADNVVNMETYPSSNGQAPTLLHQRHQLSLAHLTIVPSPAAGASATQVMDIIFDNNRVLWAAGIGAFSPPCTPVTCGFLKLYFTLNKYLHNGEEEQIGSQQQYQLLRFSFRRNGFLQRNVLYDRFASNVSSSLVSVDKPSAASLDEILGSLSLWFNFSEPFLRSGQGSVWPNQARVTQPLVQSSAWRSSSGTSPSVLLSLMASKFEWLLPCDGGMIFADSSVGKLFRSEICREHYEQHHQCNVTLVGCNFTATKSLPRNGSSTVSLSRTITVKVPVSTNSTTTTTTATTTTSGTNTTASTTATVASTTALTTTTTTNTTTTAASSTTTSTAVSATETMAAPTNNANTSTVFPPTATTTSSVTTMTPNRTRTLVVAAAPTATSSTTITTTTTTNNNRAAKTRTPSVIDIPYSPSSAASIPEQVADNVGAAAFAASALFAPSPSTILAMQRARLISKMAKCGEANSTEAEKQQQQSEGEQESQLDIIAHPTGIRMGSSSGPLPEFLGALVMDFVIIVAFAAVFVAGVLFVACRGGGAAENSNGDVENTFPARFTRLCRKAAYPGWPLNLAAIFAPTICFVSVALLVHAASSDSTSAFLYVAAVLIPVIVVGSLSYNVVRLTRFLQTAGVLESPSCERPAQSAGEQIERFVSGTEGWQSCEIVDQLDPLVSYKRPIMPVVDLVVSCATGGLAGVTALPVDRELCLPLAATAAALLALHFVILLLLKVPYIAPVERVSGSIASLLGVAAGVVAVIAVNRAIATADGIPDAELVTDVLGPVNAAASAIAMMLTLLQLMVVFRKGFRYCRKRATTAKRRNKGKENEDEKDDEQQQRNEDDEQEDEELKTQPNLSEVMGKQQRRERKRPQHQADAVGLEEEAEMDVPLLDVVAATPRGRHSPAARRRNSAATSATRSGLSGEPPMRKQREQQRERERERGSVMAAVREKHAASEAGQKLEEIPRVRFTDI